MKITIPVPFTTKKKEKTSDDSDFKKVVENICKDGGSGTYHLYRKSEEATRKYAMIADGEVKDLRDIDPEHWLKVSYGGGDYQLRLDKTKGNGDEEIIKTYNYSIDGEPKESRTEVAKKKETEASNTLEIIKTSFDMAKDMKGGNSDMALMMGIMQESSRQTTLIMQESTKQTSLMFSQMMEMQGKNHESMLRMMKDQKESANPVTEALENIMQLKEVEGMMSPKIERDGTLEWVKALSSNPILAGIMAKAMNFELPQAQTIPMIQAQKPGSPDTVHDNGNKPAIIPPGDYTKLGSPSASSLDTKINPLSAKDVQGADPYVTNPVSFPKATEEEDNFELNMIEPFNDAINAGVEPPDLALILHQMIQWSVTLARMNKQVHPLMRDFADFMLLLGETDVDFSLIDKIYTEFCTAIEMPADVMGAVKTALIKIYMPVFQEITEARKADKLKKPITVENPVEDGINESESAAI